MMSNKKPSPSDIVIIILGLLGRGKKIPQSNNFLYENFFELSQDPDFQILFQDFVFNTVALYPYCESVSFAISRILGGYKIVEWRTSQKDYDILPNLVLKSEELMELLSAEDRIIIRKAAEKFKVMIETTDSF